MRFFRNHSFELSNISRDSFNNIVQYHSGQYIVGATLYQIIKIFILTGFFSRKLTQSETKYSTFDSDLLAAYLAAIPFCHLIEGCHLFILTDHKTPLWNI